jgi:uncharacterized membrane protein YeaQ/YmgE (transglycosylase-associated protein family)
MRNNSHLVTIPQTFLPAHSENIRQLYNFAEIFTMIHILLFSLPDFIMTQFQAHRHLIFILVVGMVAGLLSQMILPGRGFGILATIGIGMLGSWLGNFLIADHLTFIEAGPLRTIAAATVGAMVLSVIINLIRGGEDKDLTHWRDR